MKTTDLLLGDQCCDIFLL